MGVTIDLDNRVVLVIQFNGRNLEHVTQCNQWARRSSDFISQLGGRYITWLPSNVRHRALYRRFKFDYELQSICC